MIAIAERVYGAVRETISGPPNKPLQEAVSLVAEGVLFRWRGRGGRILLVGNGGSAAVAAHAAVDLVKHGVAAMTFTDAPTLTALSNDDGYENALAKQVALAASDFSTLIAISSSGRSNNIVNACKAARAEGAAVVTLTGFSIPNPVRSLGDFNFWTPSDEYGVVELAHQTILHAVTDAVGAAMRAEREKAA